MTAPAKSRLNGQRASSNSDEEENLKSQARNLFSVDSRDFLDLSSNLSASGKPFRDFRALLSNLYASGNPFEDHREEANKLLDVALKYFADGLVMILYTHLQRCNDDTIRLRCAMLLKRLFHPQKNLYNRIPPNFQGELKSVLFERIGNEPNPDALKAVIDVLIDIAGVLLPNKQWPEFYDFIFESLKSEESREKVLALDLLPELMHRCPGVFLFHVDLLSDAFMGIMCRQDSVIAAAAVEAAVALVLHLATPSNHDKYYGLLVCMGKALVNAVDGADNNSAKEIIEDITLLALTETRFLSHYIEFLVKTMLGVAEKSIGVGEEMRESAIEFVVLVAEDVEYGCGMIQNICPKLRKRLFTMLLRMLATIEEDPSWDQYDSGSESEAESSMSSCSYAMKAIPRLVRALREDVILESLPDCFPQFMEDSSWQWRHAAITALGLVADGCPKTCSGISETFLRMLVNLCVDKHIRVRCAAIQAIGQFAKHWEPLFQGGFYSLFFPCLIALMEDFKNPKLQRAAISTMVHFSKNCGLEIFRPYLKRTLSGLCTFLQKGLYREEALMALTSLANNFQKELNEYYDAVLRYTKVCMAVRNEKRNWMVPAKALICMTTIAVAIGKNRFKTNVDKVIETLISFQECGLESDDPMRYHILQAWARLGKCLGADFVPYLSVSMRQLFESANLQNYLKSDKNSKDERCNVVEEIATACEVLCIFATEFTAEIHLWIYEILLCLVPLLIFKYDARVRTHAVSTMPFLLQSVSCAVDKSIPLRMSLKELSYKIIQHLIDALRKEMESEIHLKILEALNKCIKITGSHLDESVIIQFIKAINEILSTYSNIKTERRRRVQTGLDQRRKPLLQEEIEMENNIYRAVADCLSSIVKIFRTSFLPLFDKLLPCLVRHWKTNSTEQRIFISILRDIAMNCREDAFKHYENILLSLLKTSNLDDPSVWQLIGYGISICAEFGGNAFKPHREAAVCALEGILSHPHALISRNVSSREIAVFALGKTCKFHFDGPNAHVGVKAWLTYLPLRNSLAEAREIHDDLCTMVETTEKKVLGPSPGYSDYKLIMDVFVQILFSNNILATKDTSNRIKKILRKFKERLLRSDFETICSSFPVPVRTVLTSDFEIV